MAGRGFQSTFAQLPIGVSDFVDTPQQKTVEEQRKEPSTFDRVVELLNEAQLAATDDKLGFLRQVEELIVHKEPNLLDNFFDEMVAHFQDRSQDVRKVVVGFLEEACFKDSELVSKVVPFLLHGIKDSALLVKKRTITACTRILPTALLLACQSKSAGQEISDMWDTMDDVKSLIIEEINGRNDGIRTLVIKFMEMLVLIFSKRNAESDTATDDYPVSLDMVHADHKFLRLTDLCEDCGMCLESLLGLTTLADISSTNLMAVIAALANIARRRPMFMSTIVQAFEALHASLPPFSKSQVSSIRKNMKSHLMAMLRHSSSQDFQTQITTLLADLGATPAEIAKNKPQQQSEKRRSDSQNGPAPKKLKTKDEKEDSPEYAAFLNRFAVTGKAIDDFHKEIVQRLTPVKCAELVFVSMRDLPDNMPSNFRETFTPIAAAGTEQQIDHLARLMAIQITAAGFGPAAEKIELEAEKAKASRRDKREKSERRSTADVEDSNKMDNGSLMPGLPSELLAGVGLSNANMADIMLLAPELIKLGVDPDLAAKILPRVNPPSEVSTVGQSSAFGTTPLGPARTPTSAAQAADPFGKSVAAPQHASAGDVPPPKDSRVRKARHIKPFKLLDVPIALSPDEAARQMAETFSRLVGFGDEGACGDAATDRTKILVGLAVHFPDNCRAMLLSHIMKDVRKHFELSLAWLYEEYAVSEGYFDRNAAISGHGKRYDECLTSMLVAFRQHLAPDDRTFTKVLIDAPCVTQGALEIVRSYCEDEEYMDLGLHTLSELVSRRPGATEAYLYTLLDMTSHSIVKLQDMAIEVAKKLFQKKSLEVHIVKFACKTLAQLHNEHPPAAMSDEMEVAGSVWTEELISSSLRLFLSLLPLNHALLHDLAHVYAEVTPSIKKVIHKQVEKPIREIGLESEELLKLIEECPLGAESLVARLLHTLTLDARPSPVLVEKARDLHKRRVSDIRVLIPVLIGLEKSDILEHLPQLIKQQPAVMREVMNRLLGCQSGKVSAIMKGPLSPSEILIALHTMEENDEVMKNVMKAISYCFEKEAIFTQETVALVVQQLVERQPLPTLFMRTVIQSLNIYPRMMAFSMGILERLVKKQAWKQPKVWQGFIKCCSMTKPQSLVVLLQLPRQQLDSAFQMSSDLQDSLVEFVKGLSPKQRNGISKQTLKFIESVNKTKEESLAAGAATGAPAPTSASDSASPASGKAKQRPSMS